MTSTKDYLVVGLNHKTAPLALRENLAFNENLLPDALSRLVRFKSVDEGLILSTCNRVEVYAASSSWEEAAGEIRDFLSDGHWLNRGDLESHFYSLHALEAVRHGFRVASSLDSMVIGENQIVSQVKRAYDVALSAGSTGPLLNRFLNRALNVSKRVRTETALGAGKVSVGSVAIDLALKIFDNLAEKKICLVGAGEVCELVLGALTARGVGKVITVNRTHEHALRLAAEYGGTARPIESLFSSLLSSDVAILSVAASHGFILSEPSVHALMRERKNRPLFLIDLGVPRCVEPEVNSLDAVYLYNLDDLKKVSDTNLVGRMEDAERGERIVDEEAKKFYERLRTPTPLCPSTSDSRN